jgi:hypothetical protein
MMTIQNADDFLGGNLIVSAHPNTFDFTLLNPSPDSRMKYTNPPG